MREPTWAEIDQACLYRNPSFGLMSAKEANKLRYVAREWFHAFQKVNIGKQEREDDG